VIVLTDKEQDLAKIPTTINDYEHSRKNGQSYYITAQITPDQLSKVFIIGDGKVYGGYRNVPLEKGGTYTIAERAITSHQGVRLLTCFVNGLLPCVYQLMPGCYFVIMFVCFDSLFVCFCLLVCLFFLFFCLFA